MGLVLLGDLQGFAHPDQFSMESDFQQDKFSPAWFLQWDGSPDGGRDTLWGWAVSLEKSEAEQGRHWAEV